MTSLLAIGKLTKPFGLAGGIKAKSFSGENDHFLRLSGLSVQLQMHNHIIPAGVKLVEMKGDIIVMFFHGYPSPEDVAKIRGYEIWVPRHLAAPLQEGEFYMSDLIDCTLEYQGISVGRVVNFFESAQMVLEVLPESGKPFYIPFSSVFIGEVDLQNKRLQLLDGRLL